LASGQRQRHRLAIAIAAVAAGAELRSRDDGSAGKNKLGNIIGQGDRYLRGLFTAGRSR
jgi:hypothetical protein